MARFPGVRVRSGRARGEWEGGKADIYLNTTAGSRAAGIFPIPEKKSPLISRDLPLRRHNKHSLDACACILCRGVVVAEKGAEPFRTSAPRGQVVGGGVLNIQKKSKNKNQTPGKLARGAVCDGVVLFAPPKLVVPQLHRAVDDHVRPGLPGGHGGRELGGELGVSERAHRNRRIPTHCWHASVAAAGKVDRALPGVRLVTWTIPAVTWTILAVIDWCLRPYALLGLSLPLPGGVGLVTWTGCHQLGLCFDAR
jgi:hypothetical protein